METRIIKFRGWHTVANKMLFVGDDSGTTHPLDCAVYAKNQPVILMQFTGLLDKNGVEIYEGDRLEDPSGEIWIVCWYSDHACFGWYNEKNQHVRAEIIDNINTKVIGNLYISTLTS